MSIIKKSAAITATVVVAAFGAGVFFGPSISTEIEISAPAAVVWKELTDGTSYPEWNPFVKHLSGDLVVGKHINVTIQFEGKTAMNFTPEVLVVDENAEFRWVGKLGFRGVFDGEHYFRLEETDEGTTILHHGESFRGVLAYPLIALVGEGTKNGFEAMNQALKQRAELKA
ncbi:SRPBCC domain-containing protein [Sulfitobacter sp. SK012]|uniref:SRPBCC domain-containing protein n=1 Tax=Sulfitobacter sp. SK012 TaxID=1389005 RepID=UPI000E0B67E0|nr:SRPBCC domain-containing protein [Sulfitobacter sp. SK012]AXI47638.1 SRPBCC domain-containing protein [Sulfitobacter sp. SK012]